MHRNDRIGSHSLHNGGRTTQKELDRLIEGSLSSHRLMCRRNIMLQTVVLFFALCAIGAGTLLVARVLVAKRRDSDHNFAQDQQNLHTRYSFGEFSHEEYQGLLAQLRSPSTVQ